MNPSCRLSTAAWWILIIISNEIIEYSGRYLVAEALTFGDEGCEVQVFKHCNYDDTGGGDGCFSLGEFDSTEINDLNNQISGFKIKAGYYLHAYEFDPSSNAEGGGQYEVFDQDVSCLYSSNIKMNDAISFMIVSEQSEIEQTFCQKKCAYQNGDVHMQSFDGLRWDCQARGVFQTFKGMHRDGSAFQIQSLLMGLADQNSAVSVTRALHFHSGRGKSLTFSVPQSTASGCPITTVEGIDAEPVDLSADSHPNIRKISPHHIKGTFPDRGAYFDIYVSTNPYFGCYFSTSFCTTNCDWTSGDSSLFDGVPVTGLMGGKPDDVKSNDWIKPDGSSVSFTSSDVRSQKAYDFCQTNYCLSETQSLFSFPMGEYQSYEEVNKCSASYNDEIEQKVNDIENNSDYTDVVEFCQQLFPNGGDLLDECYLEGVVGGVDNTAFWYENERVTREEEVPQEVTEVIDEYNAGGARIQPTVSPTTTAFGTEGCEVRAFVHCNYVNTGNGNGCFTVGTYGLKEIESIVANDGISSIQITNGYYVHAYNANPSRGGANEIFSSSVSCLVQSKLDMNDRISYMEITDTPPITTGTDCDEKCAYQTGDVHMTSFDGLRWDCQAKGVMRTFMGEKVDGSFFEIQSVTVGARNGASITRAVLVSTGDGDLITISVPESTEEGCPITVFKGIDNAPVNLSGDFNPFDNENIIVKDDSFDLSLSFLTDGVDLSLWTYSNSYFGCLFSFKVCTTNCRWTGAATTTSSVTGLMGGNPDGITSNDWIQKDGTAHDTYERGDLRSDSAYYYCVDNYCLNSDESLFEFSFGDFESFSAVDECSEGYDSRSEDIVKNIENNPEFTDVVELCNRLFTDEALLSNCKLEGVVGGEENVAKWAESENVVHNEPVPEEVTTIIDEYEGGGAKQTPAPTTSSSGVKGDPHFKRWSGIRYDYHGICDLLLLSNPNFNRGLGMEIHVRSKKTLSWSYISTAVIRIGSETFEVAGKLDGNSHWLNGVQVAYDLWGDSISSDSKVKINGYRIRHERPDKIHRHYIIDLDNLERIEIKTWKDMVRVDTVNNPSLTSTEEKSSFSDSLGLMGSYPDGIMYGRDGKTVFTDINDFGQEWQVTNREPKIFHMENDGPQYPAQCESPSAENMRRRLASSTISRADAEKACRSRKQALRRGSGSFDDDEFDLCVFDVMATGDIDVAVGAY